MKLFPFTLGRSIDLSYSSNRIASIFTLVFGIINFIYWTSENVKFSVSLYLSLMAGATVFLSWAIAREIDPDHPTSASIAMILTALLFTLPLFGSGSLLLQFFLLLMARMINHSTGRSRTVLDWVVLLTAIVLVRQQLFSLLTNLFTHQNFLWTIAVLTASLLTGFWIQKLSITKSKCDDGKTKFQTSRVKIANEMLLFVALIMTISGGRSGLGLIYPIWTGFCGAIIMTIYNFLLQKKPLIFKHRRQITHHKRNIDDNYSQSRDRNYHPLITKIVDLIVTGRQKRI